MPPRMPPRMLPPRGMRPIPPFVRFDGRGPPPGMARFRPDGGFPGPHHGPPPRPFPPRGPPKGPPRGPKQRGWTARGSMPRVPCPRGEPPLKKQPPPVNSTKEIKKEPIQTVDDKESSKPSTEKDSKAQLAEEKTEKPLDENNLEKGPSDKAVLLTKIQVKEDEPFKVTLDNYNCDLHFNIDESGLVGWTLHDKGFEYLWGGCRGTHGVKTGKV